MDRTLRQQLLSQHNSSRLLCRSSHESLGSSTTSASGSGQSYRHNIALCRRPTASYRSIHSGASTTSSPGWDPTRPDYSFGSEGFHSPSPFPMNENTADTYSDIIHQTLREGGTSPQSQQQQVPAQLVRSKSTPSLVATTFSNKPDSITRSLSGGNPHQSHQIPQYSFDQQQEGLDLFHATTTRHDNTTTRLAISDPAFDQETDMTNGENSASGSNESSMYTTGSSLPIPPGWMRHHPMDKLLSLGADEVDSQVSRKDSSRRQNHRDVSANHAKKHATNSVGQMFLPPHKVFPSPRSARRTRGLQEGDSFASRVAAYSPEIKDANTAALLETTFDRVFAASEALQGADDPSEDDTSSLDNGTAKQEQVSVQLGGNQNRPNVSPTSRLHYMASSGSHMVVARLMTPMDHTKVSSEVLPSVKSDGASTMSRNYPEHSPNIRKNCRKSNEQLSFQKQHALPVSRIPSFLEKNTNPGFGRQTTEQQLVRAKRETTVLPDVSRVYLHSPYGTQGDNNLNSDLHFSFSTQGSLQDVPPQEAARSHLGTLSEKDKQRQKIRNRIQKNQRVQDRPSNQDSQRLMPYQVPYLQANQNRSTAATSFFHVSGQSSMATPFTDFRFGSPPMATSRGSNREIDDYGLNLKGPVTPSPPKRQEALGQRQSGSLRGNSGRAPMMSPTGESPGAGGFQLCDSISTLSTATVYRGIQSDGATSPKTFPKLQNIDVEEDRKSLSQPRQDLRVEIPTLSACPSVFDYEEDMIPRSCLPIPKFGRESRLVRAIPTPVSFLRSYNTLIESPQRPKRAVVTPPTIKMDMSDSWYHNDGMEL